ncbi:MAG TPA: ABC transporter substrate-binding protein, partial [Thermoplasmata archaeon]|nr:ABC transporter substrate-binding protein [Thermoplasmata archaeon]
MASVKMASPRLTASGVVHTSSGSNLTFRSGWYGTYIDTLNPFVTYSELSGWINFNTLLPLVHYNDETKAITPALASNWTVNFANHTVIFHLNPNAVWSDGVPITSEDVNYSYNISQQSYSFIEPDVAAVQNVRLLGPSAVQITFTGSLWLWFAAIVFVVPAHVYKYVNASTYPGYNATSGPYFVGDGPFVLQTYVTNQYAILQKNPRFFIPSLEPTITTLIFNEFSSVSSATSALQARQIDGLSGLLPASVSTFQNNSNFVVSTSPGIEYFYLAINVNPAGH